MDTQPAPQDALRGLGHGTFGIPSCLLLLFCSCVIDLATVYSQQGIPFICERPQYNYTRGTGAPLEVCAVGESFILSDRRAYIIYSRNSETVMQSHPISKSRMTYGGSQVCSLVNDSDVPFDISSLELVFEINMQRVSCPIMIFGSDEAATCPSELNVPLRPGSSFTYSWNATEVGQSLSHNCPEECISVVDYAEGAKLVRRCIQVSSNVGEWTVVDLSGCQLSKTALELCEAGVQLNNPAAVSESVVNITSNSSSVDSAAVAVASNIVEDLTKDAIEDIKVRENYLKIIDNLISTERETLLESERESGSSSRILESLSTFTSKVLINSSNPVGTVFAQNNFAVLVDEIDPDTFVGETFNADLGDVNRVSMIDSEQLVRLNETLANATASVEIPASLYEGSQNDSQRLSYSIFLVDSLFLTEETDCQDFGIASVILSVSANITTGTNDEGLLLTFQRLKQVCNEVTASDTQVQCANFEMGGAGRTGRWTTEHCKKVIDRKGRTTCRCQQLGHFGLLFDLNPGDSVSPLALALICYVGATISSSCLIIIIVTYLCSRKLRGSVHGQLLVQFSLALVGLYATFLMAGHVTSISEVCVTVAALLHYFILVFFGLTAAESIHLYKKLVTVFASEIRRYTLKAAAVVWFVPVVIVVVAAGAGNNYYSNPYFCRPTGYPFSIALVLPFCIIYVFNWIVFGIIMTSLLKKARHSHKISAIEREKAEQVKRFTIIALGLSIVFGLGWGLGLAATSSDVEEVTFVFQVLFSLFVGTQGILIFILHGLRSEDARSVWKMWFSFFPCIHTSKTINFSQSTERNRTVLRSQQAESMCPTSVGTLPQHTSRDMNIPVTELPTSVIKDKNVLELEAEPEVPPTKDGAIKNTAGIVINDVTDVNWEQADQLENLSTCYASPAAVTLHP